MNVIQVVSCQTSGKNETPGITGPERRAANLAQKWQSHGIDVTILYPRRGALWKQFRDTGLPVFDCELDGKWQHISFTRKLRTAISHAQATVIHSQGGPALDLASIRAASISRIGSIITRPVMIADQVDRKTITNSIHALIDKRITLARCTRVVAVSQDGYDRLRQQTNRRKVVLIPNGVPIERFQAHPATSPSSTSRKIQIGMIGHLLPYKGWEDFISTAAVLRSLRVDAQYHVIGEGPQKSRLQHLASEAGLAGSITFHGQIHDVAKALRTLDIFLFTSHREGMSIAILEAMASGLPIVATNVGGTREQVQDGKNGFLVTAGNLRELAAKCLTLANNDALRKQMGQTSRSIAEQRFSEDAMLTAYARLYKAVAIEACGNM